VISIKCNEKPLSVNKCWQGQRFKTRDYKKYEKLLLQILPKIKKMPNPPYFIVFEFGVSSKLADWDNPVKPLQDIIQKKYGFDDRDILVAKVDKKITKKNQEYFKFIIGNNKDFVKYLCDTYNLKEIN
jgi:hypothetical protein